MSDIDIIIDAAPVDIEVSAAQGPGQELTSWTTQIANLPDFPATFPASSHTHAWADVTGKPTTFTPSAHVHAWGDITSGVPASFTPSAHKSSHATGGTDALTPADIGAQPAGSYATSNHGHDAATTGAAGFMSADDKIKLDGVAAGATAVTVVDTVADGNANAVSSNAVFDALAGKANALGPDDNYVTDAEKTKLSNLSGTNTGDETAAAFGPKISTAGDIGTIDDAVDKDAFAVLDQSTTPAFGLKKLTFANLWAWVKGKIDAGQTWAGEHAFSSATRPTSAGTGTPAATSLITLADLDNYAIDTSVLSLRDDFMGLYDAQNPFGQLGWSWTTPIGTGTLRPMGNISTTQTGIAALTTTAAFRAANHARFDVSNSIGGGGLLISTLENATTRIKFRFRFSSLDCTVRAGLGAYADPFRTGRFLGFRYAQPAAAWTANQVVTLNEYRRPTVANGRRYYASVGGNTHAVTEPTWPTTNGGTVTDGTVTWTEGGKDGNANLQFATYTSDEALGTFTSMGVAAAANTWYEIELRWISGTTWAMKINGGAEVQLAQGFSAGCITPVWGVESTVAVAQQIDMDFFGLVSRITRP